MQLNVRFAGTNHALEVEPDCKIKALYEEVQTKTGVFVRNQKLIHKGKVLPRAGTLAQAKLPVGAKLMLLASDSAVETQGQAAAKEAARIKAAAVAARVASQQTSVAAGRASSSSAAPSAASAAALKARAAGWVKTGVVSLSGEGIDQVPQQALEVGSAARVLDLSLNRLAALPMQLSSFTCLQRLHAHGNLLTSRGLPWDALAALPQLSALTLGGNRLEQLPDDISRLTALTLLSLEGNALPSLPGAIGSLPRLAALSVRGNRLRQLPPELPACSALLEIDASGNLIDVLPMGMGRLTLLRSLRLDNNRLASLPADLLRNCSSLCTLSCHNNPLTIEQLRESEGFEEYDTRRRAKHDKQIDMQILDTRFDEGADIEKWDHWAGRTYRGAK